MTSTSHPGEWTNAPIAAPAPRAIEGEIARVEVFPTLAEARRDWLELQAVARASPYQAFVFAEAWFATIGAAGGFEPLIVVARDASGQPAALLPLARRARGPLAVATFLGGKDSNFNLGLFRPGRIWSAGEIRSFLTAAAGAAPARIDGFALLSQPREWQGVRNPMAALGGTPSPSFAYKSELPLSFSAWRDTHLSKAAKKNLRRTAGQLAAMGPVAYVTAQDETQASRILAAFFDQKRQRASGGGPPNAYECAAAQAFLRRLAGQGLAGGPAAMELHALMLGDRAVAVFGALPGRIRLSGFIFAHERDPEIARCGPGRLLLHEIVRSAIERGFETLDLGVGEAPYKTACCEEPEVLFDTFIATSALGTAAALGLDLAQRTKSRIKRSPRLMSAATRLRAGVRGLSDDLFQRGLRARESEGKDHAAAAKRFPGFLDDTPQNRGRRYQDDRVGEFGGHARPRRSPVGSVEDDAAISRRQRGEYVPESLAARVSAGGDDIEA
jgi:CelD/BcsL family acetyltransferase involved in cellulose biosynthesis